MTKRLETSLLPELDLTRVKQELAKRNLEDFVKFTMQNYQAMFFHRLVCDRLQKVYSGDIKFLIIEMPPQNGKTQLVSKHFPAWCFGKNPNLKIGNASYSEERVQSYNTDTQRIIDSLEYKQLFPKTTLPTGKDNKKRTTNLFELVGGNGCYKTESIGGAWTGTTIDIGIIDDPVKDAVEAESYTYRERVWKWYTDVFSTRLHNDSRVIITMTRWHIDDLVGRILKNSADECTVLHLPAIKENDNNPEDIRQIGEALWPEKHSLASIHKIQKESPRTFAALYQQNPRPVQVGGEVYYGFKPSNHISQVKYKPELPLHISWDFNRLPYTTCLITQVEVVDGYTQVRFIDELCLPDPARTKGTAQRFVQKYFNGLGHKSGVYIYGDPSGRQEDSKTEKGENNYKLITNELAVMRPSLRVATAAPSVDMRINWINDILENNYGNIKLLIDPKCTYLINDMQYIKIDPKGGKLKEKGMIPGIETPCEIYGHTSDALEYLLCQVFNTEYERFQRGGAKSEIMYTKKNREW